MVRQGRPLCAPVTDEQLANPLLEVDPLGWLGPSIAGLQVLCLAAGGGRQSALYASAGAHVTVVDLSPEMLRLDREVAAERRLSMRILEGSMEDLSMLPQAFFDLVIHPVSTCYVPDIRPVYRSVAAVLRPGGLYISQHKQPVSLQSSTERERNGSYVLCETYYRTKPIPPPRTQNPVAARLREFGTLEYLHRWEEIIGGMCRAGFVIEDLVEPFHAKEDSPVGSFADRARYIAPYVRIKARRIGPRGAGGASGEVPPSDTPRLWLPASD